MGLYLDNKETECAQEASMAKCDGCGEGLTAMERCYKQAAVERQTVEETLDEVAGGCVLCFVKSTEEGDVDWSHEPEHCQESRRSDEESGIEGMTERENPDVEKFRSSIKFEARSHSCFKCGFSQKLCLTGRSNIEKCQWPNVMAEMLKSIMLARGGGAVLDKVGFRGEQGDWSEYSQWLGLKHERRVWGELMSNATALVVEFIVWATSKRRDQTPTRGWEEAEDVDPLIQETEGAELSVIEVHETEEGEEEEDEEPVRGRRRGCKRRRHVGHISSGNREEDDQGTEVQLRQFIAKLRGWESICLICKAAAGVERRSHSSEHCVRDDFLTEMLNQGKKQMRAMEEPMSEQGKCWVGWQRCENQSGSRGFCRWSDLAREIAITLLYVGSRAQEVQDWIREDDEFVREVEDDGQKALEGFFKRRVDWGEVESNMLCELIRRFG